MSALLYLSVFSFGVKGFDVDLIVSVPEFSYLVFFIIKNAFYRMNMKYALC